MATSTFCFQSIVSTIMWRSFTNWEWFPSWSCAVSSSETTHSISKISKCEVSVLCHIAAVRREYDISYAPSVMQPSKNRVPTGSFHPYWKPGSKGTCNPFTIPARLWICTHKQKNGFVSTDP